MRPIQVLVSSLLPFLIGLLTIYFMLYASDGGTFYPFNVFLIIVFYVFPAYCLFCLPFYYVVYYLRGQLKRSMFLIIVIVFVYLQGFVASFLLHLQLFGEQMLTVVFPLFAVMMLTFVCCLFMLSKRFQTI